MYFRLPYQFKKKLKNTISCSVSVFESKISDILVLYVHIYLLKVHFICIFFVCVKVVLELYRHLVMWMKNHETEKCSWLQMPLQKLAFSHDLFISRAKESNIRKITEINE